MLKIECSEWVLGLTRQLLTLFLLTSSTAYAKEVSLKWEKKVGAHQYHLQVSPREDFSEVIVDKTTKTNALNADLAAGVYYLRVAEIDKAGRASDWSKGFRLVVTAPIDKNESASKKNLKQGDSPYQVHWKVEDRATSYKVTLIRNADVVKTLETTDPHFDFEEESPGEYQIFVSSGMEGEFGPKRLVQTVVVHDTPAERTKPTKIPQESSSSLPTKPFDKEFSKKWNVGTGPVISNSLQGSGGTKYEIYFAVVIPQTEYWDFNIFYDGNFNSATQGSSAFAEIGAGGKYFLSDRLSNSSPFLTGDLGYGGGNKNFDAFVILGAGLGWQFFRTEKSAFEVLYHASVLTGNGGLSSFPSWQSLRLAYEF